jgi:hypothetical protein
MSTNKVNLSLDEIISKRKDQNFKSGNTQNKRFFTNNKRDFGERRRYLNKEFKNFSDKNYYQRYERKSDKFNNNQSYKPNKFDISPKNDNEETIEIKENIEETKVGRLLVSNLQRDVVNSELRVKKLLIKIIL